MKSVVLRTHPDSETTRSRILAIVPTLFLAKCEFAVNIWETMSILDWR
jgi:hypothetical protein